MDRPYIRLRLLRGKGLENGGGGGLGPSVPGRQDDAQHDDADDADGEGDDVRAGYWQWFIVVVRAV